MSMLEMLSAASPRGATAGRTPVYRVMLDGELLEDVSVQEATLVMSENSHDMGAMTISSAERTTTDGLLDTPISFLFGPAPNTEVFCGYVTAISEVQNDTGVLTWTMEITGPTKSMQTGTPRFWTGRSIPNAVETLAYSSYLGYAGHAHDHLWSALAQTDESDWKMAIALAGRLGWSVYNRYGVVGLYDPLQLFKDEGAVATLISESYVIAKSRPNEDRVLLDFEPSEEAKGSSTQQGLKAAYFNADRLQVAYQGGEHASYRFVTDLVIRGAAEAALYVNGHDSDVDGWAQKAQARVIGNATLYPGMTVEVMTTSRQFYAGKFNGRWLIRGVQHKMDRQSFQSNLVLARPDGKTPVFNGGPVPFWQQSAKAKPTLTLSSVASSSTLPTNRVWVSSWTNSTVANIS